MVRNLKELSPEEIEFLKRLNLPHDWSNLTVEEFFKIDDEVSLHLFFDADSELTHEGEIADSILYKANLLEFDD